MNVRLNNVSSGTSIGIELFLFDLLLNSLETTTKLDVFASIAELARLDDPPSESVLALFVEFPEEGQILLILDAAGDVESEGDVIVVFSLDIEVCLHCFVECLFVTDHSTIF